MCGKFTSMASWAAATDPAQATICAGDREIAFRVMGSLPVIVWDPKAQRRRVVAMRWGFPARDDWRRPQPIHARAESIDTTPAFAGAFAGAQRGIVLVKTFNEAPENGEQHVVMPDMGASGIAVLWRRFEVQGAPAAFLACVMVTVPANELLRGLPTDRMPAILSQQDWPVWLGETAATPAEAKACLKTVEGTNWKMSPEKRAQAPRRKPTASDPGGLF